MSDRRIELGTPTGRVWGHAIDLRDRAWSPTVAELRERLPRDGSWRERVGIDSEIQFSTVTDDPPPLRQLLAVAGRSRGTQTPYDAEIRRLAGGGDDDGRGSDGDRGRDDDHHRGRDGRGDHSAGSPDAEDLRTARQRVAETGTEVERLRERVAMLRGRLQARRETEAGVEAVQSDLDTAMRDLTEAETEQLAAEQRLTQICEAVRPVRDGRRESMRRADALRNRLCDTRDYLADTVSEPFAVAVEQFEAGDTSSLDGVTAHLAAVTVAETTEPVILAAGRFDAAERAANRLGTPVVLLSP